MKDLIQDLKERIEIGLQYDTISGGTANDLLALVTKMQVKNNSVLAVVTSSLPVKCIIADKRGEYGHTTLSVDFAGEMITKQSRKIEAFENFIDKFNENYR